MCASLFDLLQPSKSYCPSCLSDRINPDIFALLNCLISQGMSPLLPHLCLGFNFFFPFWSLLSHKLTQTIYFGFHAVLVQFEFLESVHYFFSPLYTGSLNFVFLSSLNILIGNAGVRNQTSLLFICSCSPSLFKSRIVHTQALIVNRKSCLSELNIWITSLLLFPTVFIRS